MQRRLTGLGFDTKQTGKFDDETRAVIKRWQAARGYPSTGYFNKLQHKALLAEIVPSTQTAGGRRGPVRPAARARAERRRRRRPRSVRRGGDAGAAFIGGMMGGMMGGMFRR